MQLNGWKEIFETYCTIGSSAESAGTDIRIPREALVFPGVFLDEIQKVYSIINPNLSEWLKRELRY